MIDHLNPSLVPPLLAWYHRCKRTLPWRQSTDPYRVWVSEIMLQQTRVEAVIPYYNRFMAALPTLESLAQVPEDQLMKLWEGLGYYSRARNLQKAACQVVERHNGQFPTTHGAVLALAGVGDYTAGAICSICFGLPTPGVDGNVLRVVARLTGDDRDIADPRLKPQYRALLETIYPPGQCGDFTQSLMELGATVCTPTSPKCGSCPLGDWCTASALGLQGRLPVKSPKKPRRAQEYTVLVLCCGDRVAVEKRPAKGLLAALWQFPNQEGALASVEAEQWAQERGLVCGNPVPGLEKRHIFTHVEWQLTSYRLACKNQVEGYTWVTRQQLEEEIALPSAFRDFATMV